MKWAFLLVGLVIGAIGGAIGWISWEINHQVEKSDQLVFAPKVFYDSNSMDTDWGLVVISGTLVGQGMAYPNNTYGIACYKQYKACFVSYVEQIGHEQLGRIQTSDAYPIIKWDTFEVVAQDEPNMFACRRVTITIARKSESLLWYEEPVNQTKPNCKDVDASIAKYSIDDAPRWKQLHAGAK